MKIFNFLFPWKHNSKQRRKCAVTSLRQGVSIVSKGVSKATQLNYQTAVCSFLMFKAKDDVAKAAKLLSDNHIKRVVVTDEDGILVGIVSRRDIVKMLL